MEDILFKIQKVKGYVLYQLSIIINDQLCCRQVWYKKLNVRAKKAILMFLIIPSRSNVSLFYCRQNINTM